MLLIKFYKGISNILLLIVLFPPMPTDRDNYKLFCAVTVLILLPWTLKLFVKLKSCHIVIAQLIRVYIPINSYSGALLGYIYLFVVYITLLGSRQRNTTLYQMKNSWNVKNLVKCYNLIEYWHFLRFCTLDLLRRNLFTYFHVMKDRFSLFSSETILWFFFF